MYTKNSCKCDKADNSGKFILNTQYETLLEIRKTDQVTEHVTDQAEKILQTLGNTILTTVIKLLIKAIKCIYNH